MAIELLLLSNLEDYIGISYIFLVVMRIVLIVDLVFKCAMSLKTE
jgi:hypothetical protein